MKKITIAMLLPLLFACSKDETFPVATATVAAEEYIIKIRSIDPSLAKLTLEGVYEKTMTSYEEYFAYLTNLTNNRDNTPVYPIPDLDMPYTKFRLILSYLVMTRYNTSISQEIGLNHKFYEVRYKLSPTMQGGWRFVILVNKDMQLLVDCKTIECLQSRFDSQVSNLID